MHASVRGRRGGRQHDAGSMQFRCAHLIGVLDVIGISPEHGIIVSYSPTLGQISGLFKLLPAPADRFGLR